MARPKKTKAYRYKYTGRYTKLTEPVVKKLEEAFAVGANVTQACYYANISRQSYYNWTAENPDLMDRFEDLTQKLPLQALHNIAKRIHGEPTKGDIDLSKWLLERRQSDDYGEKIVVKDGSDVATEDTPEEDKEAIEEFHAKLKANRLKRSMERAKREGEI